MWKRTDNHPLFPPIVRKMLGRPMKERIKAPSENNSQVSRVGKTRQYVFRTHASANGRGRGSRGGRGVVGGRNRSGRGEVGGRNGYGKGVVGCRNGSANRGFQLMDEDEIRVSLEHDYMQDLLDAWEDKRQ
ncbi:hypothetical protein Tco_0228862 [Tanacetum coccineum]